MHDDYSATARLFFFRHNSRFGINCIAVEHRLVVANVGIIERFERASTTGDIPVLLTSPLIRPYVRSIIERFRAQTTVMSQNEIHPSVRLRTMGQI